MPPSLYINIMANIYVLGIFSEKTIVNHWNVITVELQWLEHLWNHEHMFETGVARANEG